MLQISIYKNPDLLRDITQLPRPLTIAGVVEGSNFERKMPSTNSRGSNELS